MNIIKLAAKIVTAALLFSLIFCFIQSRMDHFSQTCPFCRPKQKKSFRAAEPEQEEEFESWDEEE